MSTQDSDPPFLRTVAPPTGSGSLRAPLGSEYGIDELAELVADLLSATQLVPADKLAVVRGRARQTGSLAQALVEEGVASSEGVARIARRAPPAPLVDLARRRHRRRRRAHPAAVLERVVAMPYAVDGDTLQVASPIPANIHGIDELRLATRHPVELAVAPREDILIEVRRLARASEALGRASALDIEDAQTIESRRTRTTTSRSTTASRTPRSSGSSTRSSSRRPRTAPSDVHFEPQEDCAPRPVPRSTACSRRCSASRSGSRPASRRA